MLSYFPICLILLALLITTCTNQNGAETTQANSCSDTNAVDTTEYDRLYLFFEGEYVGFIDRTGRVVVPPIYYETEEFSEGLCFVFKKGKKGEYIFKEKGFITPEENE